MNSNNSEAKWIEKAREGDQQAFAELLAPYRERLYRKALSMAGNHDDAMDILQEAIIASYRSLHNFRQKSSFYTWIFSILLNAGRNFLKKRNRSASSLSAGQEQDFVADERLHFQEKLELSEQARSLMSSIDSLDGKYREIIILRYYDELSYEQIAEALHINSGTVKSRLNQARELLRRKMHSEGTGENQFV